MTETADYIIVGAGSAGCVLADRLSEDGARVLLLEAGPSDRHPMIHIPAGILSLLSHPRLNWNFHTEPEKGTGGRAIHWPRGKVLGGSSSINGMLYVRGNPSDYDGWAQMGCRGWSFDEVLPYFKLSESYDGGDDALRGRDGPLSVEDHLTVLPLTHDFVAAARQAGFPFNADNNGARQEGASYTQMTRRRRFRGSTARTYLARARKRPGLKVVTNAQATGLILDGKRCTGVAFRAAGHDQVATAQREVIVCGGAVNSPHLLQVSGIGPAEHLKAIGVPVAHDLPGVGANLTDHYVVRIAHRMSGKRSINELSRGWRVLAEAVRYAIDGRGALTFGVSSAQVFCHSREGLVAPDLQLLFTPASYAPGKDLVLEREPGCTIAICPVRPSSRGTINAASSDPLARPDIRPGYLSSADDIRVLASGLREARRIQASPALADHTVEELRPGAGVESDDEVGAYARETGNTLYHPVGTCKMGTDPMAVVDPTLRVHGIEALRVVDASVMPTITSGNTNAPTIMIAEKAAAMIREGVRAA